MKHYGCQATKGETSLAYDESNFLTTTKTTKIFTELILRPPPLEGKKEKKKKRLGLGRLREKNKFYQIEKASTEKKFLKNFCQSNKN